MGPVIITGSARDRSISRGIDGIFDHDLDLLDCACARGLIDRDRARRVAENLDGRSAAVVLVQEEGLSITQVRRLLALQRRRPLPLEIAGYRLRHELGRGGMAIVYAARAIDDRQPREVAIKILCRRTIRRSGSMERFVRELRAAEQVVGPEIVHVFGSGTVEDRPYLVMEAMPHGDLEGELLRGWIGTTHEVLEMTWDACRGAQTIADAGWVHRDLKPSNLFRDASVGIKIGDLGLAKQVGDSAGPTLTGQTVGTPEYMPPEQVAGEACDIRWDVYALGVMMFQFTSGQLPFSGATHEETMQRVLVHRGPKLHQLCPQIDADFEAVGATAMSRDPRRRYRTPSELGEDCRRLLAGARPRLIRRRLPSLRRSA
jgi:serine/threonine protein kinase